MKCIDLTNKEELPWHPLLLCSWFYFHLITGYDFPTMEAAFFPKAPLLSSNSDHIIHMSEIPNILGTSQRPLHTKPVISKTPTNGSQQTQSP
jgi:hypothetical protein